MTADLDHAAELLRKARHAVAFTGAGISVESGLDTFRGPGGLWAKVDPEKFEKRWFVAHPAESWALIKDIFYSALDDTRPNPAHLALARLEAEGRLAGIITQNIDHLHQVAGSRIVHEYHGGIGLLDCLQCRRKTPLEEVSLAVLPPPCPICGGLLKPDIVFFGEPIPEEAYRGSLEEVEACDVMLVVGTTGEVMPASRLPHMAKNKDAAIIEVNVQPSAFTGHITDIFLQGKAGAVLTELVEKVLA